MGTWTPPLHRVALGHLFLIEKLWGDRHGFKGNQVKELFFLIDSLVVLCMAEAVTVVEMFVAKSA